MTYNLHIDGRETRFEVREDGAAREFRLGSDRPRQAQLVEVAPGVFSVLLDGRSYEARAEARNGAVWVDVQGRRMRVELEDPRRGGRNRTGRRAEGSLELTAPMPGKVIRLLVAPGDPVAAGQGLVVVEAMKMQNEMKASRAGRVAAIPVREGETVGAGAVLVVIE